MIDAVFAIQIVDIGWLVNNTLVHDWRRRRTLYAQAIAIGRGDHWRRGLALNLHEIAHFSTANFSDMPQFLIAVVR